MNLQIVFLCLITAHLLGDFTFQTAAQVEGKKAGAWKAYLSHGAVHMLLYLAILLAFIPAARTLWSVYVIAIAVASVHILVDRLKEARPLRKQRPSWTALLIDQAIHLLTLFIAAILVTDSTLIETMRLADAWLTDHASLILGVAATYVGVVFGGGYLIRAILNAVDLPESDREDDIQAGQERLGMYIGWLERTVVLTALLANAPGLVGFVIAAKAVIRFEKKPTHFAEYFLLGTFLSLILAGAGSLFLRRWLFGDWLFTH